MANNDRQRWSGDLRVNAPVPKRIVFAALADRAVSACTRRGGASVRGGQKNRNTAGTPAVFLVQHFRMDQKS
jgi:hypothetical protein